MSTMSYQEAKAIRNMPSLSEMIRRRALKGQGAGQAIKESIKEKFNISKRLQAKVTGYKEKFDPLNIAKFMTGGSKLAPALLGRMLGRSQEDIEYFAGKPRGKNTAERIKRLPQGSDEGRTASVLRKIYKHMVKTQDRETKQGELLRNQQESRELQADKRHKELLNALSNLTGVEPTSTIIKTSDEDSIFNNIKKWFAAGGMGALLVGAKNMIEKALYGLYSSLESIFTKLTTFLKSSVKLLYKLIGNLWRVVNPLKAFLMNPWVLGALAAAAAIYGLKKLQESEMAVNTKLREVQGRITSKENTLKSLNVVDPKSPMIEKTQKELEPLYKERDNLKTKLEKIKTERSDAKEETITGKFKSFFGMNDTDADYKSLTDSMPDLKLAPLPKIEIPETPTPTATPNIAPEQPANTTAPVTKTTPKTDVGAMPVSKGTELFAKSTELVQNKMRPPVVKSSTTNNNTISQDKSVAILIDIPSVRNQEETFKRMVYESTRVV